MRSSLTSDPTAAMTKRTDRALRLLASILRIAFIFLLQMPNYKKVAWDGIVRDRNRTGKLIKERVPNNISTLFTGRRCSVFSISQWDKKRAQEVIVVHV